MHVLIKQIKTDEYITIAIDLFSKYQTELDENICFQNFDVELADPIKKYNANNGGLFFAYYNSEIAGCIALQNLENDVCEMKRLFVLPAYRKYGIGKCLVMELLKYAAALGYKTMKLDTLAKLVPAIKLYEQLGFKTTDAYYHNPLPNVVYMEKEIEALF
jgi:putative acetyltransferase